MLITSPFNSRLSKSIPSVSSNFILSWSWKNGWDWSAHFERYWKIAVCACGDISNLQLTKYFLENSVNVAKVLWQNSKPLWTGPSTRSKKWRCKIFSDVGGPTMVGSNVPGEILKKWPPRLAKPAFSRTNFY